MNLSFTSTLLFGVLGFFPHKPQVKTLSLFELLVFLVGDDDNII